MLTECKKRLHHIEFQVLKQSATPLLGLTTCIHLGLIKHISEVKTWPSQDIQEKYADVFDGLGWSIIHAPRKVPVALRDKVKAELRRMENLDVIEKVTEPRQWVSSMVTVWKPKKQKIRICMDPKDLNAAIEREHYPMRTIKEMMARMAGAKVFSTLDAQCG